MWTVGVIAGLIVALSVAGAFVGTSDGSKKGKTYTGTGTLHYVKRKPLLGTRLRPIPLGTWVTVSGAGYEASKHKWRVKVTHFLRDANAAVAHVKLYGQLQNHAPAKGSQYVLVSLSLKYIGGGSAPPRDITNQLSLIGKHAAPYSALDGGCAEPRGIDVDKPIYSGQSTSGEVCLVIASNDASTLRMYLGSSFGAPRPGNVWFALR